MTSLKGRETVKRKKFFGLALALAIALNSLGTSFAAERQRKPVTTLKASGSFSTSVSAGKVMKLGGEVPLAGEEIVHFNAPFVPKVASVDFGILDSNNTFIYITASKGSVNGGITIAENGWYTPAIRNNSTNSVFVSGYIEM